MGRDASHSNSLFQAAETVVRRLCELHSKVGSIEFLLPRPSSPPSLHDARSIFHFLLVHVMDNCCYIGLILISLEREMEGGGINLCNNIICKTNIAKRKESSSVYYYLFLVHRTLLAKTQGKCSFFSLSYACMQIPLIDSRILLSLSFSPSLRLRKILLTEHRLFLVLRGGGFILPKSARFLPPSNRISPPSVSTWSTTDATFSNAGISICVRSLLGHLKRTRVETHVLRVASEF